MNIAANNKDTSTSDDSGFWLLCTDEGKISVSSREAVRAGFTSGVKSASDVIAEDQIPELEDVLRIVSKGGDVSVLMSASPATGYSIAHLSSGVLFSAAVVEIRLYKNKSEYLADSAGRNSGIGRVFGHMGHSADPDSTEEENAVFDIFRSGLIRFESSAVSFLGELANVAEFKSGKDGCDLTDVSAVFDIVSDKFNESGQKPFMAVFENSHKGNAVVRRVKPENFVGMILMSAAVAARLSDKRECRVSMKTDGDSVIIETGCRLHRDHSMYCRSCELMWLHRCLSSNPTELLMLEYLLSFPDHSTEFRCDMNGDFVLRMMIDNNADPDRLKFRDSTVGVDIITDKYMKYLRDLFSSDPQ